MSFSRACVPVLAVIFAFTLFSRAAEPDFTIELGKRVGAITKNSTLKQLKESYGAKNVKSADLPGPEGTTLKGAILFGGGDREMHVIWNDEKPEKEVYDVQLVGKAWAIGGKLRLGATLGDVESVNGGAFKVSGFGWDLGGIANFEGGKLGGMVMVCFDQTGPGDDSLVGDRQISSGDKRLRASKPVVIQLFVVLR